jgi:hypothetical protein
MGTRLGIRGTGRIALSNAWSHAAPYSTSIAFPPDSEVLTCQGVYIDEIDGLGYDLSSPRSDPLGLVILPRSNRNAYKTEDEGFEALWHSIVANKARYAGSESQAPKEVGPIFLEQCRLLVTKLEARITDSVLQPFRDGSTHLEKWFQRNWNFTFAGKTLQSWALENETEFTIKRSQGEDARAAIDMFHTSCMSISHNRRLATTMEGYVGHVPRETKPGDAIYVLPGCKVPVVVRKMGGQ